jgi:hypothetical protein
MRTREEFATITNKFQKYVLEEESILSTVLKGQLLIENEIEFMLNHLLKDSSTINIERMYLPQKIDLLIAIGALTKEEGLPYKKLNSIRRKFAHKVDYKLNMVDLLSVRESLSEKHLQFHENSELEDELAIISELKLLILTLFSLLSVQNAIDEYKGPGDPVANEELVKYLNKSDKRYGKISLLK